MFNVIETDSFLITEFNYSTMYVLLQQIYTNYEAGLPPDPIVQLDLLKGATKYKLEPLIKRIEQEYPINTANFVAIYESVKMLGNQELLGRCKEYGKNNWGELQKKITHKGVKDELVDYIIGRSECKHEQALLFTTY